MVISLTMASFLCAALWVQIAKQTGDAWTQGDVLASCKPSSNCWLGAAGYQRLGWSAQGRSLAGRHVVRVQICKLKGCRQEVSQGWGNSSVFKVIGKKCSLLWHKFGLNSVFINLC